MIRRNARLRREYLYRKNLESKETAIYERKQKLKQSIQDGKPVPTELRRDAAELQKQLDLDDSENAKPTNHIDDEYAFAGVSDPKVLITTSRDPSSRLSQFLKEMRTIIPNSQRINRGGHVVKEVVELCRNNDVTDLIVLHEHRGQPDGMVICHLPYGPTAYFGLSNVVLRHDLPDRANVSEAYPNIILDNFNSTLGGRVGNVLKHLFPVPKEETKRVLSFVNREDQISFRHHIFERKGKQVMLEEVGPRFEMKLYQIKLGTLDMTDAENEWVLRPYMNAAKKRKTL